MDNLKWNHKKYLNIPKECRGKRNKEKNLGGQTENKQNRKKTKTKIMDLNAITLFNHQ